MRYKLNNPAFCDSHEIKTNVNSVVHEKLINKDNKRTITSFFPYGATYGSAEKSLEFLMYGFHVILPLKYFLKILKYLKTPKINIFKIQNKFF